MALKEWTSCAHKRIAATLGSHWQNIFGAPVQEAIAGDAAWSLLLTQVGVAKDMDAVRSAVANSRALYGELTKHLN